MPSKEVSTAKKKQSQPLVPPSPARKQPVKTPSPESSSQDEEETESSSEEEEENEPSKDSGKVNPQTTPSAPVVVANSDSESESEEEDEPPKTQIQSPKTTPSALVVVTKANSDSESESEAESEEATKTPASLPNKKRQSKEAEVNASKRAKTESETETVKKAMFHRVWTDDDEIVLLQGMCDFYKNTGKSAHDDMHGFFETIYKYFSFEVKFPQFSKKIRNLKNKYLRKKRSGLERSFTSAHDVRCLELAKLIWVNDLVDSVDVKSRIALKIDDSNVESDWFERSFLVGAISSLAGHVDEKCVIAKWNLMPLKTKKKFEEKWKSLEAHDNKSVVLKTDLLNEVSSVMFK